MFYIIIIIKDFIRVTYSKAYLSDCNSKRSGHSIFNRDQVVKLLQFIVDNSYIEYNGKIYRQHTGIPMGIDPAPFMANLFLHYFENKYIVELVDQGNIAEAGVLKYVFRYLDDLLSLNDSGYFQDVISTIYPVELILSKTNVDPTASEFLDMFLSIANGKLDCTVFDKRRNFPFKVVKFPDIKFSNVPERPSYGIFYSQMIRILRICNKLDFFISELEILCNSFLEKGYEKLKLLKIFERFMCKYVKEWGKFGAEISIPTCLL